MNVYDFDKTIYDGDSTLDFYFYCLKKHPEIAFCLARQLSAALKYKLKRIHKVRFKEEFYSFLSMLKNVDEDIIAFWNQNQYKMKDWYLLQQEEQDLVISASPEFLLREICMRVGIKHLIASVVDKKNGIYSGENCYGGEKVNRFRDCYPNGKISSFYSDSLSDQPMAEISNNAFLVKGDIISRWE